MKKLSTILSLLLVLTMLLSLSGCSSVPLLKGGDFSREYKHFIKNMQKTPPVSLEFEQYLKPDGFQKEKLITDTDPQRLRELAAALAVVEITEQVESASNFAVRYYCFEDENGEKFTFEFYGEYLKCEDKFYKTENSLAFISIRPEEKKSGKLLVALDEAHEGRGEEAGKMYISCRELKEGKGGKLEKTGFGDYELAADANITAPVARKDYVHLKTVEASEFFANLEQVKGQDNPNFVCHLVVERGVITALSFDRALSEKADFY